MARKKHHEEHANHEAWAIPYGDLVTLLLAFFVVMYSISSVNEGKYRVLADSLSEAFGGPPRSVKPLQLGRVQQRGSQNESAAMVANKLPRSALASRMISDLPTRPQMRLAVETGSPDAATARYARAREKLETIAVRVEEALAPLIRADLVVVTRTPLWLEVEVKADILFDSGSAAPREDACATIARLGQTLAPFPNGIRIEGHTDDRPIATAAFPSNWELSAARAASVVRLFAAEGVATARMTVIGYGQERPKADNADIDGRSENRRVVLAILATPDEPGTSAAETTTAQASVARSGEAG